MNPVYLDHNATTPVAPEVRDAMLPWLGARWGNPSSGHAHGKDAADAVERARGQLADLLHAKPEEIIFTSGGTESNNMVFRSFEGAAVGRVLISAVEHPSVLGPAEALAQRGWKIDRFPPSFNSVIDLLTLRDTLSSPAALISVMLAQNETGSIQPVAGICGAARDGAEETVIHTDAAQAVGKIPVDLRALRVDCLSLAGHKFGAPQGIGALFVREGLKIAPLMLGGGQEQGRRPGTQNVPYIVGLGEAAERAGTKLAEQQLAHRRLCTRLFDGLAKTIPEIERTVSAGPVLPNTLHVSIPGCDSMALLADCPQVSASTGSACHSGARGGVLTALGMPKNRQRGALRLSVGQGLTGLDIDRAIVALVEAWQRQAT